MKAKAKAFASLKIHKENVKCLNISLCFIFHEMLQGTERIKSKSLKNGEAEMTSSRIENNHHPWLLWVNSTLYQP